MGTMNLQPAFGVSLTISDPFAPSSQIQMFFFADGHSSRDAERVELASNSRLGAFDEIDSKHFRGSPFSCVLRMNLIFHK